MKIHRIETVEITPTTPFDFDSTFHKPDHFTSGEPGIRWYTWAWRGKCLGLKLQNMGQVTHPRILGPIIQRWQGMRPGHPSSLYEYLVIARFGKYKQLAVHYIGEDLWWKRKNESIPWLEKLIRV